MLREGLRNAALTRRQNARVRSSNLPPFSTEFNDRVSPKLRHGRSPFVSLFIETTSPLDDTHQWVTAGRRQSTDRRSGSSPQSSVQPKQPRLMARDESLEPSVVRLSARRTRGPIRSSYAPRIGGRSGTDFPANWSHSVATHSTPAVSLVSLLGLAFRLQDKTRVLLREPLDRLSEKGKLS
jgi:hypothetical protein